MIGLIYTTVLPPNPWIGKIGEVDVNINNIGIAISEMFRRGKIIKYIKPVCKISVYKWQIIKKFICIFSLSSVIRKTIIIRIKPYKRIGIHFITHIKYSFGIKLCIKPPTIDSLDRNTVSVTIVYFHNKSGLPNALLR